LSTNYNQLLALHPHKWVLTQRWLSSQGIDRRQAGRWVANGRLERLGHGAYKLAGAAVDWPGAVHAIQMQWRKNILLSAHSAIEAHGYAHNITLGIRPVCIFAARGTRQPAWFEKSRWSQPIKWVQTDLLPFCDPHESAPDVAKILYSTALKIDDVLVRTSSLERAALEMFYLVPKHQSYDEAFHVMESLASLRPKLVQALLQLCSSNKTKRLFMYTAERVGHTWVKHINLDKVDFGSGRLTIHSGGRLNYQYDLVVNDPQNL